uniref:Bromodomain containing protein n=1 Tax=Dicyema japonicum TaxID=399803 RepID=B9ZYV7_DICJA|nr:bromodomain containing protein [Dicyema japonicum]
MSESMSDINELEKTCEMQKDELLKLKKELDSIEKGEVSDQYVDDIWNRLKSKGQVHSPLSESEKCQEASKATQSKVVVEMSEFFKTYDDASDSQSEEVQISKETEKENLDVFESCASSENVEESKFVDDRSPELFEDPVEDCEVPQQDDVLQSLVEDKKQSLPDENEPEVTEQIGGDDTEDLVPHDNAEVKEDQSGEGTMEDDERYSTEPIEEVMDVENDSNNILLESNEFVKQEEDVIEDLNAGSPDLSKEVEDCVVDELTPQLTGENVVEQETKLDSADDSCLEAMDVEEHVVKEEAQQNESVQPIGSSMMTDIKESVVEESTEDDKDIAIEVNETKSRDSSRGRRNSSARGLDSSLNKFSSRSGMKCLMSLWQFVSSHKYANLFMHKVTDDMAPDYSTTIKRPTDLSLLRRSIENGIITDSLHFQQEIMLMFTNALFFNSSDEDIYKYTLEIFNDYLEEQKKSAESSNFITLKSDVGGGKRRNSAKSVGSPPAKRQRA